VLAVVLVLEFFFLRSVLGWWCDGCDKTGAVVGVMAAVVAAVDTVGIAAGASKFDRRSFVINIAGMTSTVRLDRRGIASHSSHPSHPSQTHAHPSSRRGKVNITYRHLE
jgi:hypothetical protein